jgi:hypothetical protein
LHHFLHEWPGIIREFLFGIIGGLLALLLVGATKKIIGKSK